MKNRIILSDNITKQLEDMIANSLHPGDRLPTELELSEQFGVGRSTIRESMKVLAAKGLIVRRNEGTFVSNDVRQCLVSPLSLLINMKIGKVKDLLELRRLLELSSITIAAERITPEIVQELEHINWQMSEPGLSTKELQRLDIVFHSTIFKATGNEVLMELLNATRQVIAQNLENDQAAFAVLDRSLDIHQKLIEALKLRDADHAYAVMRQYFDMTDSQDIFNSDNLKKQQID